MKLSLSVRVAEAFGCDLVRVCIKTEADIARARSAAELMGPREAAVKSATYLRSLGGFDDPLN